MSNNDTSLILGNNFHIGLLVFIVLTGVPLFFFIDSPWLSPYYAHGQDLTNIFMFIIYSRLLWLAPRKLYWLIILMTLSGFIAEVIGSLILQLYKYRFDNIPMYIPLGHAAIYVCMYQLSRQSWVWRHHRAIERCLGKFAFIAAFLSLFFLKDVGGFICYIIFLVILRYRTKPLFYLFMFAMVYYIELFGTVFSTWAWYTTLGIHPDLVPIGYTPSGMAGLYVLIDLTSNSTYYYARKVIRYLNKVKLLGRVRTPLLLS